MISVIKKYYLAISITILGIFLRIYHAPERMHFTHDGDLYSWIVKDILVDHHLRLIGQLTSSPGIFIGPLFYYLLVPFYWLTNLDPIAGVYLSAVLSVLTMISTYTVFKKVFNNQTGLIGLFLQAILLSKIEYDMWVVPTVLVSLWSIWYFYVIAMLIKGNFKVLPLLAVLVSLIWHIHFGLAPLFLAVPVAIVCSGNRPTLKQLCISGGVLLVTSLPLFLFEVRHHFSQTLSFISSFQGDQGGGTGIEKFWHVLYEIGTNVGGLFYLPYREAFIPRTIFMLILLSLGLLLVRVRVLSVKLYVTMMVWFFSLVAFYTFSSKIISEYYFEGLNIILFTIVVVGISYLCSVSRILKLFLCVGGLLVFCWSAGYILTDKSDDPVGYLPKKQLAHYIVEDAHLHGYPCIAISYLVSPGELLGMRYFFYLEGIKTTRPEIGVPVYSVVFPLSRAEEANQHRFGALGVILPQNIDASKTAERCAGENSNITEPLFGYTD